MRRQEYLDSDLPLREWDALVPFIPAAVVKKMKENGDCLTLATGGCTLKEAARKIKERV